MYDRKRGGTPLKYIACCMLAAGLGTATANTLAQAYPSRLIRIVVAFSPGGVPDILARVLAKEMQGSLGQSVVVDNRPGGGGVIGADAVAKAPTDGYTVILITSTHIITPLLFPAPYDPSRTLLRSRLL